MSRTVISKDIFFREMSGVDNSLHIKNLYLPIKGQLSISTASKAVGATMAGTACPYWFYQRYLILQARFKVQITHVTWAPETVLEKVNFKVFLGEHAPSLVYFVCHPLCWIWLDRFFSTSYGPATNQFTVSTLYKQHSFTDLNSLPDSPTT